MAWTCLSLVCARGLVLCLPGLFEMRALGLVPARPTTHCRSGGLTVRLVGSL